MRADFSQHSFACMDRQGATREVQRTAAPRWLEQEFTQLISGSKLVIRLLADSWTTGPSNYCRVLVQIVEMTFCRFDQIKDHGTRMNRAAGDRVRGTIAVRTCWPQDACLGESPRFPRQAEFLSLCLGTPKYLQPYLHIRRPDIYRALPSGPLSPSGFFISSQPHNHRDAILWQSTDSDKT